MPALRFLTSLIFLMTLSISMSLSHAQTVKSKQENFKIEIVASGLNHPWAITFLPNGDKLITERSGSLRLIHNGKLHPDPVQGLPRIASGGQGGLLDIILHPDFKQNRLLYFSFSARGKGGLGTEVAKAKFDGRRLSNVKVIFRARPKTGSRLHFGSRLVFDHNKKLFITIGEKFRMKQAQDPRNHLGTVIRLNADGSIPSDNPFAGKENIRPEIFSYGHRNPQGMARHPSTGRIWMHEHGPQGGDEVNILKKGRNYGWPAITYGIDYSGAIISDKTHAPGMEQPVIHWTPSIAPSGMAFYTGNRFKNWKGDLFVGSLAHTHLRRLELSGNKIVHQEKLLEDLNERIRDVRTGPDGYLYVLTDSSSGQLLRLKPAN